MNLTLGQGPLPLEVRKAKLVKLQKILHTKEVSINKALKDDLGKSAFESYLTEVGFILEEIKHTLSHLDKWVSPKKVSTPLNLFPGKSYVYPEPYGKVLIIGPWNYPFQLSISPLVGAIAAGNRVVIKPSEFSLNTSKIIKDVVEEVFDKSEVQVIEGGVNETQELLKTKFDYIFFTGSTAVGKVVMRAAAEHLTPVTLELGGKSPCLIEESAKLDLTAKRCAWGKFMNAGQTCIAPDYVLVPKKMQNEFIERLQFHLKNFYGESHSSADYAKIINSRHFDRLEKLLIPGKIAFGGKINREDRHIEPTVMKDVSWEDKVMEEEIFGPILPVIPYENLNEITEKIISLPKPLAFYLFSENKTKRDEIMKKVSFGGGCINDTIMHIANPHLPFGGVGPSGIGSYHGKKSFETFSHMKSVFEQKTGIDIPLRYPPYEGKLGWLKFFVR